MNRLFIELSWLLINKAWQHKEQEIIIINETVENKKKKLCVLTNRTFKNILLYLKIFSW